MNIISGVNQSCISNGTAQQEALEDINQLLAQITDLLHAAQGQNMNEIQKDRPLIDQLLNKLRALLKSNPDAFTAEEKAQLTGGQGLFFFGQTFDNTFDNFYTEIGEISGAMFGLSKALQIELQS